MKRIFTILCLLVFVVISFTVKGQTIEEVTKQAQAASAIADAKEDHPWTFGGGIQLIVNQTYSKNWVGASNPTLGFQGLGNLFLKYHKGKLAWENTLNLDYGIRFTFNPPAPRGIGTKVEKTSDLLDFKSKFGYKAGGNWYYGIMFTLSTQMSNGYSPDDETLLTSSFMTPGYVTFSIGMDYKPEKWSWYISPIGTKIVTKIHENFFDQDAFGVLAGKKVYAALGASTHLIFAADIHPKINLNTKLELFYDYLGEMKQLRNLDMRYDMTWMFNITEWLCLSLKIALLYDYDIKFNCYDADGNIRYTYVRDDAGNIQYGSDGKALTTELKTDHLQFQEAFGLTLGYKFKLPSEKSLARKESKKTRANGGVVVPVTPAEH